MLLRGAQPGGCARRLRVRCAGPDSPPAAPGAPPPRRLTRKRVLVAQLRLAERERQEEAEALEKRLERRRLGAEAAAAAGGRRGGGGGGATAAQRAPGPGQDAGDDDGDGAVLDLSALVARLGAPYEEEEEEEEADDDDDDDEPPPPPPGAPSLPPRGGDALLDLASLPSVGDDEPGVDTWSCDSRTGAVVRKRVAPPPGFFPSPAAAADDDDAQQQPLPPDALAGLLADDGVHYLDFDDEEDEDGEEEEEKGAKGTDGDAADDDDDDDDGDDGDDDGESGGGDEALLLLGELPGGALTASQRVDASDADAELDALAGLSRLSLDKESLAVLEGEVGRKLAERERRMVRPVDRSAAPPQGRRATHRKLTIIMGEAAKSKLWSPTDLNTRPMMASVRGAAFSMLTALLHGDGRTAGTFPPATRWLDLFAGTGAVGLEALSRGCAHATFVELDPWVVEHCLRRNLAHTRYLGAGRPAAAAAAGARAGAGGAPGGAAAAAGGGALRPGRAAGCADVRVADVMVYLGAPPSAGVGGAGGGGQAGAGAPFDVVSVCPPYDKVSYPALLAALDASPLVAPGALLVVEYPRREAGAIAQTVGARLVRLRDRRYGRTRVAVYEAALADGSLASEARGGGGGGDGEGGAAGGGEAAGGGVGQ